MRGIGARSVTTVALFVGAAVALWRVGHLRADYWDQLSPWVPFLAGGFAVGAGTLVFAYWRLGERSTYYFRYGYRLPFGGETSFGGFRGRHGKTLLVGHAPHVSVADLPPFVHRTVYIATFSCIALVALTNRAVALLRDVPDLLADPSREYCAEPEAAPPPEERKREKPGCAIVRRAFQLGYTKDLGSCAPDLETDAARLAEVCRRRQHDEPYLHYAWRLFDTNTQKLFEAKAGSTTADFGTQLDHFSAMFGAMFDSVAMRPRSSHHLFTNLPDPRPSLGDQARAAIDDSPCGARLANLAHFPRMQPGATGASHLLEHVIAQLLFNPTYKPVVAECKEIIVHWGAPADACAKLAADPAGFLDAHDTADVVHDVLEMRRRKLELSRIGMQRQPGDTPTAQRVVSFQCLVVGDAAATPAPIERTMTFDGETFRVREARMTALSSDEGSQIRLYKDLAELLAEGFGYGRLTSQQAVGARPEEATMAASFKEPTLFLTKLDLLRDADLFLGNDWLANRQDLLDVYPYHLHLLNFVEIFRRQYQQHRGRL
jgi:hypothetical protein